MYQYLTTFIFYWYFFYKNFSREKQRKPKVNVYLGVRDGYQTNPPPSLQF